MSTEQAVAAEYEAIDLDLAWRTARASRFEELIAEDGITHPIIFKRLDGDPYLAELERKARRARAVARVRWIEAEGTQPQEETSP